MLKHFFTESEIMNDIRRSPWNIKYDSCVYFLQSACEVCSCKHMMTIRLTLDVILRHKCVNMNLFTAFLEDIPFGNKSNVQKQEGMTFHMDVILNSKLSNYLFITIDRGAKHLYVFMGSWQPGPICRPLKHREERSVLSSNRPVCRAHFLFRSRKS